MSLKFLSSAISILGTLANVLGSRLDPELNHGEVPIYPDEASKVNVLLTEVEKLTDLVKSIEEGLLSRTRNELPLGGTHEKSVRTPRKSSYRRKKT